MLAPIVSKLAEGYKHAKTHSQLTYNRLDEKITAQEYRLNRDDYDPFEQDSFVESIFANVGYSAGIIGNMRVTEFVGGFFFNMDRYSQHYVDDFGNIKNFNEELRKSIREKLNNMR